MRSFQFKLDVASIKKKQTSKTTKYLHAAKEINKQRWNL